MTKPESALAPTHAGALSAVLNQIGGTLKYLAASGVRGFDCSAEHLEMVAALDRPPAVDADDLATTAREVQSCARCGLAGSRRRTVFGEGDARARLVFVGEGPGYEEDRQGRPFVGPAGQLLTKIIQAMGLSREDVYICNVVKCRPPDNRTPEPGEIEACLPYLRRQLAAVRPEFICALGAVAARTLLDDATPISLLRGRLHRVGALQIVPTYHPAFLLRNPTKKRDVWEDIQMLMRAMGLERADGENVRR